MINVKSVVFAVDFSLDPDAGRNFCGHLMAKPAGKVVNPAGAP